MTTLEHIEIQLSQDHHAGAMEALFLATFDAGSTADNCEQCIVAVHYRHHRLLYPEGQFVATERESGLLVGFAVSRLTSHGPEHPHRESWWESSGQGWLNTHEADGEWLYGVESVVRPEFRGMGIGTRLMDARKALVRRNNLRGIVAGSMPRDFHLVDMTIDDYVRAVAAGDLYDTNLSKQLHMGFEIRSIIPNYVIDAESRRFGVLIVWYNPEYRPSLEDTDDADR